MSFAPVMNRPRRFRNCRSVAAVPLAPLQRRSFSLPPRGCARPTSARPTSAQFHTPCHRTGTLTRRSAAPFDTAVRGEVEGIISWPQRSGIAPAGARKARSPQNRRHAGLGDARRRVGCQPWPRERGVGGYRPRAGNRFCCLPDFDTLCGGITQRNITLKASDLIMFFFTFVKQLLTYHPAAPNAKTRLTHAPSCSQRFRLHC